MWPYLPDLLSSAVPRYTSYPTAAEFSAVPADFHKTGFGSLASGQPVSLYVHIPFCEKICWYCGCNTGAANRAHRLTAYLDALHTEIEMVANQLGPRHQITQIAFGGGSPNAIAPVDFVRLLDHLMIAFDGFDARVSIELDPRSLSTDWIGLLGRTRITHASLGVQTFESRLQERIGRIQPSHCIEAAVAGLRREGVSSLNFDLMYGLPGQSVADLTATLEEAITLAPERIALFGYAHLPSRIPRQRQIDASDMPGSRARFDMAVLGYEMLTEAGYQAIGFDHFAKPDDGLAIAARTGTLRRNFQGFTDDQGEALIGLGASAISRFPNSLVQNRKNAGAYRAAIEAGDFAAESGLQLDEQDISHGRLIEDILCAGQCRVKSGDLTAAGMEMLDRLAAMGLVTWAGDTVALTETGRPYARLVASQFDTYRTVGESKFSVAV